MRSAIVAAFALLAAGGACAMDVKVRAGSMTDPASDCPTRFERFVAAGKRIADFDGKACTAHFSVSGPLARPVAGLVATLETFGAVFGTTVVSFDSPGGDIEAAIALGRAIRKHGAGTVVRQGSSCASACVYAFAGGTERQAAAGGLKVHRIRLDDLSAANLPREDGEREYRKAVKAVRGYFAEMRLDAALLDAAEKVPSADSLRLSRDVLVRYRLIDAAPFDEERYASRLRILGATLRSGVEIGIDLGR